MRFFKRKQRVEESALEMLKKNPDKMFVCDEWMGVYMPKFDQHMIVLGNYLSLSEQELNELLVRKFMELQASKN